MISGEFFGFKGQEGPVILFDGLPVRNRWDLCNGEFDCFDWGNLSHGSLITATSILATICRRRVATFLGIAFLREWVSRWKSADFYALADDVVSWAVLRFKQLHDDDAAIGHRN